MIYRFGHFELDDSARELRRGVTLVNTEPKVFDLLAYLIRNRDCAVSKDELLTALWPRSIVTETALSRCVMKARRAIDDDSSTQAIIRTLRGYGYRFVAELDVEPRSHAIDDPRTNDETQSGEPVTADMRPEDGAPLPENSKATGPLASASQPAAVDWVAEPLKPLSPETAKAERTPYRASTRAVAALVGAFAVIALGWFLIPPDNVSSLSGTVAVLPVSNQVEDSELGWVRLGLMSLLARLLEETGVEVVPEQAVLGAIGDVELTGPPDGLLFESIRRESGADSVLHTALNMRGELYRLAATVAHADGRLSRRTVVGESLAALTAEIATLVGGVVGTTSIGGRFSKVSTDPFVNELYARALDLELRGHFDEARDMFKVAVNQEPDLFWLRYEIALCTRDLREWDEAATMFDALYEEARSGTDARALLSTLNSHGVMRLKRQDYASAEALFLRALDAADDSGRPNDRATALVNLGLVNRQLGNFDASAKYFEDAVATFTEAGEEPAPSLLNNYAGLLLQLGQLDAAEANAEGAVEGFHLRGRRHFEAQSLNRLANILRRRGDIEGAIEKHEQALAIYRELGNVGGELSELSALTSAYQAKGDLTRARLNADDVIQRAQRQDDERILADAYLQSAYVASIVDDHMDAISDFGLADAIFEAIDDNVGRRAAKIGLALSLIETGDTTRARGIADDIEEFAVTTYDDQARAASQWLAGRISVADKDLAAAKKHFLAAVSYARDGKDLPELIRAASSLAKVRLELGEINPAQALVEEIRPLAANEHDFLRLDARLAVAQGDETRAVAIMSALRARAGEAWNANDKELLATLTATGVNNK